MSGGGEGHFLDDIPKSNRIWYALVLIKMACPLYTFSKAFSMCAPTCVCMFSVIITMHEGLDRKSYLLKSKVIFPHSWPCDCGKVRVVICYLWELLSVHELRREMS